MELTHIILITLVILFILFLIYGYLANFRFIITKYDIESKELYDIGPFTRIYWSNDDKDKFFKLMGFTEAEVLSHIQKTYYWEISSFNPRCAKDPFTCAHLMCIRYFIKKNMKKESAVIRGC